MSSLYFLSNSQCLFDRRCFLECDLKFADVEVGDNEVSVSKGGGFILAAEFDHLFHEGLVGAHFAKLNLQALCLKVADGFVAPWAAGFDVEDGCHVILILIVILILLLIYCWGL